MDYCEAYGKKKVMKTNGWGFVFAYSCYEAIPEDQRFIDIILIEEKTTKPFDAEDSQTIQSPLPFLELLIES